ncbi:MAG: hypothetical protein H0X45_05960 [Planctomycetes bacterium]|nr:hypothetical protein [Planctomycetota bacterium]
MPIRAAFRPLTRASLVVLMTCIVATTALAAADEAAAKAENTVDPFDGKPIDPAIPPTSLTVAGRTWVIGFSSEANKRAAQADPRKAIDLHRRRSGDEPAPAEKPAPQR